MQVSYSIAVAEPLSVFVDTYGTGKKADADILAMIRKAFDFRPGEPPGAGRHGPGHVYTASPVCGPGKRGHVSGDVCPHLPRTLPAIGTVDCCTLPAVAAHLTTVTTRLACVCSLCWDARRAFVDTRLSPTAPLRSPARPPGLIAKHLDLKRGGNKRYQKTAAYGHFGRDDADFTWEQVKPLE